MFLEVKFNLENFLKVWVEVCFLGIKLKLICIIISRKLLLFLLLEEKDKIEGIMGLFNGESLFVVYKRNVFLRELLNFWFS